ncbi:MAG: serine protease, partial [Mesorhizobium sp.]|nr:serine protease [Mesorhizobium sp.]
MSSLDILRRHRVAALLGAALVISPVAYSVVRADHALAATTTMTPVPGVVAPHGSFAPIVAADKPAVVTVTSVMKAQPQASNEGMPFNGNSPFDQYFR